MKRNLAYLGIGLTALLMAATRGNIDWSQLKAAARHGTQAQGQASDGTGATGNFASFNADGSITDSGVSSAPGGGGTPDIFSSGKLPGVIGTYVNKPLSLTVGSTGDILPTVTAAGYVSEVFIAVNQCSTLITVTVDGEVTPSIQANLNDFLGQQYLDNAPGFVGNWLTGNNNGTCNSGGTFHLPIPFSSSVHITAKNNGSGTVLISSYVVYHTGVSNTWAYTQHLYLSQVTASGITAFTETNMVNVSPGKKGRLAGFGWIYDGFPGSASPNTAPLEGAFKIYIDGSGTSSYTSSGTEDMFGMGWYFQHFNSFGTAATTTASPPASDQVFTVYSTSAGVFGAQRFFIRDPIVFTTGLRMSWTCGNAAVSMTGTCKMMTSVYYYTEN